MITTVPDESTVTVTVDTPLQHLCPFKDESDLGSAVISWRPTGQTIELHSLRSWLDQFATSGISHESITDCITYALSSLDGIEDVEVTTRWTTAGMSVTVFGGSECGTLRTPVPPGFVTP